MIIAIFAMQDRLAMTVRLFWSVLKAKQSFQHWTVETTCTLQEVSDSEVIMERYRLVARILKHCMSQMDG